VAAHPLGDATTGQDAWKLPVSTKKDEKKKPVVMKDLQERFAA
jgi:hypothetical protein